MRAVALALVLAACSPPTADQQTPEAPVATVTDVPVLDAPLANARVTSPLAVSGTAPGNWYFENQFPVRIVNAQDQEIAAAPAHPRVSWTDPGPKQFDATLSFTVSAETAATLVLQEDMPGEGETPREVRVPIVLAP